MNTVVFDKTGTLTQGRPCLQQVVPTPDTHLTAAQLLAYAAAVERCTSHPVAHAIVQAAEQSGQSTHALSLSLLPQCVGSMVPCMFRLALSDSQAAAFEHAARHVVSCLFICFTRRR